MDVLNEFNESFDRMKTRKEANKPKKAKPVNSVATNKKEAKVEVKAVEAAPEKTKEELKAEREAKRAAEKADKIAKLKEKYK